MSMNLLKWPQALHDSNHLDPELLPCCFMAEHFTVQPHLQPVKRSCTTIWRNSCATRCSIKKLCGYRVSRIRNDSLQQFHHCAFEGIPLPTQAMVKWVSIRVESCLREHYFLALFSSACMKVATSISDQTVTPALSFIGAGKSPLLTSRQRVDDDSGSRSSNSFSRR